MAVFRAVANTPLMAGAGATALAANTGASGAQREMVAAMFRALGGVTFVDEDRMHAANAIAGCGPAYVYMVIEAMTAGGVAMGLSRNDAAALASQTVLGAALLARESGLDPAALTEQVIKPGGATAMAVRELDGLRSMLISAIEAATRHSESRERTLLDI
jgi:pyrroline-5-carboxylate reductase